MIRLEEINGKNYRDMLNLRVREDQKSLVAPNGISLIEAYIAVSHHGHAFPFGIYDGDTPVGFCMIGFDADDDWEDAPAVARGNYNLWRLMIDERYQGKGFGKAAMEQIMAFIESQPCGAASCCWVSYEPENEAAKTLYASFGFKETGEWDGNEKIAVLRFKKHDDENGGILIRHTLISDYDQIYALWTAAAQSRRALNPVDDSREGIGRYLKRNPRTCFVACAQAGTDQKETVVGVILTGHDGRRAIIHHMCVHPDFRRRGIARMLVQKAEEALRREGISKAFGLVFRDNDEANAFWEAQGYTLRTNLNYRNKSLNSRVPQGE